MISHPLIHPPGVFFGLAESEYHESLALSASGIKWLRVSSLDYWARSPLNPEYVEEETDAMRVGKAYDKRIVEGKAAFDAAYAPALDPADYPDALQTNEQIVDSINRAVALSGQVSLRGLKGMRKHELIAIRNRYMPNAIFWQEIAEAYGRQQVGKILLPADLLKRIEISAYMIERHPDYGRAFRDGAPQVSVFWSDEATGIPCKMRCDYLKPLAISDLKTVENSMGLPVDKAVARAIAMYKYSIQGRWYLDGGREIPRLWREGKVFGHAEANMQREFVDGLCESPSRTFALIFQQKGIAPVVRGVLLPELILDVARAQIADAKAAWKLAWDTYGTDPWLDMAGFREFDSSEFPAYIAE